MNPIDALKSNGLSIGKVRSFGGIWIGLFAFLMGMDVYRGTTVGVLFWLKSAALAAGLLGLAFPVIHKHLFIAMTYLTAPIGWLVSRVILGVIYFGILTPIGLALRLTGRDSLTRRFEDSLETYWVPADEQQDEESCFRQF